MRGTKPILGIMLYILVSAVLTISSADSLVSDVILVSDSGRNAVPDSTKEQRPTDGRIAPTASAASSRGTPGATHRQRHKALNLLQMVPHRFANSYLQQAKLLMFIMII